MIGLESVRQDADWSDTSTRRSMRRSHPTSSAFRARLAIALRVAADRVDRPSSATLGSSSSKA
jgi:hypothetical protein